jgi:hypothetical protein
MPPRKKRGVKAAAKSVAAEPQLEAGAAEAHINVDAYIQRCRRLHEQHEFGTQAPDFLVLALRIAAPNMPWQNMLQPVTLSLTAAALASLARSNMPGSLAVQSRHSIEPNGIEKSSSSGSGPNKDSWTSTG